jgi:exosortase
MIPRAWRRSGWSAWHLWGGIALIGLGILVTLDAWSDVLQIILKDEESSHALLVPIIVAWLVWVRRRRLRYCRPTGQWIGPVFVALGWFLYSYGDAHYYQVLWHGGALLLTTGCFLTVAGRQVLVDLSPAFVVLLFLLPVPGRIRQSVAIPMETITAQATEFCFSLLGVPVERSGNMLTLNSRDVAIAEACNGMRMVFSLAAVSFAFAFGMPLRGYARAMVLLACPLSAVLCNVLRLIPTVWLYATYPGRWADQFHDLSAWVMLVVAFLLLLGVLRLLRWALVPVTQYALAYD